MQGFPPKTRTSTDNVTNSGRTGANESMKRR